ncbi:MAG: alpha-galactosidase [Clostridia bacterium]|nr:alpha-galactosidase [Clostridia bacterium]
MNYTCKPTEKDYRLFAKNVLPYATDKRLLPFALTVDGKEKLGFGKTPVKETFEILDSTMERRTFTARFRNEKLELTVETLVYRDYPVAEWVATLKNVGKTPSGMITNFKIAKNLRLHSPNAKLHHNTGDGYRAEGLETFVTPMLKNETLTFSPLEGRACDGAFPYYRLESPTFGYNLAIGWPGQWEVNYLGGNNHTKVTLGQKDCAFQLNPGESVRSPRLAVQIYDGKTERGVNAWRRFYFAHVMPKWQGESLKPILFAHEHGDGEEFTMANTNQQLAALEAFEKMGLDFDVWWIDAGWYKCYVPEVDRNVWTRTANWDCDEKRFPNEFKEISEKVHAMGKRFLLWFEPERMSRFHMPNTVPEEYGWWITLTNDKGEQYPDETVLFKMGNEEARKWITDKYNAFIKRNRIDVYRQDFNMGPLQWWRANDEENRKGIIENHHCTGYLAFWDELKRQNPQLLIDSCASGGRRNDYDTMKRAVPFHFTDYGYGLHGIKEAFSQTMFAWIPYFRNPTLSWDYADGTYKMGDAHSTEGALKMPDTDNYAFHTSFAPALTTYVHPGDDEEKVEYCKKMIAVWRRAAAYNFTGDYYPLTPYSKEITGWYCLQFHNEEKGEGVINAVRNTQCPEEEIVLNLRQIEKNATYEFDCPETSETFTMKGSDLLKNGLHVNLPARYGKFFFYKKVNG